MLPGRRRPRSGRRALAVPDRHPPGRHRPDGGRRVAGTGGPRDRPGRGPGDGAGAAGRSPARGRPTGRRPGRPRAGPGRVSPRIRLAAARAAAATGDDRAAAEYPRRPGRSPARRPAGAVAAVRDLSPAGPHVLRRLPGRAGGGHPGGELAGPARRPDPLAGSKPGRAAGRGRPAAPGRAAGRGRATAPAAHRRTRPRPTRGRSSGWPRPGRRRATGRGRWRRWPRR